MAKPSSKIYTSRLKGFIPTTVGSIIVLLGQWWAETKGMITKENADILLYIAIALFIFGAIYMSYPFLKRIRLVLINESTVINHPPIQQNPTSKIMQVINSIKDARNITPQNNDITVYLVNNKWLSGINDREVYAVLLKLQEDEKILTVKSFPKYLLEADSNNLETILKTFKHPLDKNFIVSITDKFEKYKKF